MRVVPLPSSSPAIAKHTRTIKHKKRGMLVGVPPPFKNKKKREEARTVFAPTSASYSYYRVHSTETTPFWEMGRPVALSVVSSSPTSLSS